MPSRLIATIRDRDGAPVDVTAHSGTDFVATLEWTDGSSRAAVEFTAEEAVTLAAALLYASDNRGPITRPNLVQAMTRWGAAFIALRPEKRKTGQDGVLVDVLDPAAVIVRAPKGS